jgi:hypothetical protein
VSGKKNEKSTWKKDLDERKKLKGTSHKKEERRKKRRMDKGKKRR